MTTTSVTLEARLNVDGVTPEELLTYFDGLIASNGLHMITESGRKLEVECVDSKFTEIIEFTDEDEILVLNRKSDIQYFRSTNKSFGNSDLISIKDVGVFTIIITPELTFLYNTDNSETINTDGVVGIEQLKVYLDDNYPTYEVLRKIS